MHYFAVLLACIAAVACNDLEEGSSYGRVVFNEKIQASPYFSIRRENVTVNVTEHEVISRIVVTDERPDKDGSAKIVEGGVGHKNVTIELQSPAIFRGLYFNVAVYAVEDNGQPLDTKDINNETKIDAGENSTPVSTSQKPTDDVNAPASVADQGRINRDTQKVDPIVNYVRDTKVTTEAHTPAQDVTEDSQDSEIKGQIHPHVLTNETPISDKTSTTEGPSTTELASTKLTITEGTTSSPVLTNIPNTHENLQNYDAISKEIGQRVILGINGH